MVKLANPQKIYRRREVDMATLLNIMGLMDEPTGNLDSKMGIEVMDLLHQLNKEDGRTIIMVTHNEQQAQQTSRVVRFFDGRQVI